MAAPANEIDLRRIVEAVEGPVDVAPGLEQGAPAHRPDFVWPGLSERLASLLAETTIETLCINAAGADVPRAESEAPMYFI